MSSAEYTAVVRQDGRWWIGWIEEVPGVNCQGATKEELISNLREALSEAIEMNREDAREAAGQPFECNDPAAKRRDLIRHLMNSGCELVREGGNLRLSSTLIFTRNFRNPANWGLLVDGNLT